MLGVIKNDIELCDWLKVKARPLTYSLIVKTNHPHTFERVLELL